MLLRFLSITSLAGLIGSVAADSGDVSFSVNARESILCIHAQMDSYDKSYCWGGPYPGLCYKWEEMIKLPQQCSPDGKFCWDMHDGNIVFMASAVKYTVGQGVFKNPVASGTVKCNYYSGSCIQTEPYVISSEPFCP